MTFIQTGKMRSKLTLLLLLLTLTMMLSKAQSPSPKQHFGFSIGDNYKLANYTQTEAYFKKVAATSDRVSLVNMGITEEGRTQYMMVISSPENIKKLSKYKEIVQKLARSENLSEEQALAWQQRGKRLSGSMADFMPPKR